MTEAQAAPMIGLSFLSCEEAARVLGIAPLTLSRWVSRRKIGAYRVARELRFTRGHIQEYLERHEIRVRRD